MDFRTLLFWVFAATIVVAQTFLLRSAFSGRSPGARSDRRSRAMEMAYAVVPAVGLLVLLLFTRNALLTPADAQVPRGAVGSR